MRSKRPLQHLKPGPEPRGLLSDRIHPARLVERWSDNRVVVGITAFALWLAKAYAMHSLVEEPSARLRRRFGSRTAEILDPPGEVQVAPTGD